MLCPRCAQETEERAAFCGACGAPLTLQDEPPPRRLDLTLDLDRRGPRPPTPGTAAMRPPASVPEPRRGLEVSPEPEPPASPTTAPASQSHWDLGRALAGAAREEGFSAGAPSPRAAPPRAPPSLVAAPHRTSERDRGVSGAGSFMRFTLPGAAASRTVPAQESAAFAWSDPEEEDLPDEADRSEVHLRRPATWRRAAAWTIDAGPFVGGVAYLGKSLLSTATAGLPAPLAGLDGLLDLLARESDIILSLVALLALSLAVYATLAHALAGATLGKWMLRLRVVGPDGRRPSLARSASRAALAGASAALLGLGFLLALFTRSGRALHDLLARTWVVEAP